MNRRITFLVFLTSLAIYLSLAWWMTLSWKPLGDEPHYLLAAQSLMRDGDLDLANNYAQRDYQAYLQGETLDPHVKVLANGQQVLSHDPGLALLITPAYVLGGRAAVEFFLAVLAALLALQIYWLARDVTHNEPTAILSWLALAFTPPLVIYGTLIYPELPGALILIWAARTILFKSARPLTMRRVVALALACAALPWLSIRFSVVLALLLGYVGARWYPTPRRVQAVYAIIAVSIVAYFFINYVWLAGTTPAGTGLATGSAGLGAQTVASVARGLVGWWIDPQRGTLILAPIYLLALAGIPRLLKNLPRTGMALVLPILVINMVIPFVGGFWVPFEVGARYFVVALPLLAAPLAVALQAGLAPTLVPWRRAAFAAFSLALLLLSGWNGWLMFQDASYAYGSVVSAYSRALGVEVSPLFAGLGHAELVSPTNQSYAGASSEIVDVNGDAAWHVPAGAAGTVVSSYDLIQLTNGNYNVRFRASAKSSDPAQEIMTLDVYSAEGLPLLHTGWTGEAWRNSAALKQIVVNFDNPYLNRWAYPLTLQLDSTGAADLTVGAIVVDPDTPKTWLRVGAWIALVLGLVILLNADLMRRTGRAAHRVPRRESAPQNA